MSLDSVDIQYLTDCISIREQLKPSALLAVFDDLKIKHPVSFIFVTDDELLEINIDALGHDYYTDVITFDYQDPEIEFNEVVISYDRIVENAASNSTSTLDEAYRICIHGMLHLAGYDDQNPTDKTKMTQLENHYLALHCST